VSARSIRAMDLAKRPGISLEDLTSELEYSGSIDRLGLLSLESSIRYESFFLRESNEVDRVRRFSKMLIPEGIDWLSMEGVSIEARQALAHRRPSTLGQASRLPGVRPADVVVILMRLQGGAKESA